MKELPVPGHAKHIPFLGSFPFGGGGGGGGEARARPRPPAGDGFLEGANLSVGANLLTGPGWRLRSSTARPPARSQIRDKIQDLLSWHS